MSGQTPKPTAQVVEFNRNRHELPISVIMTNWVNFRQISGLPLNADCTDILNNATERALARMFPEGKAHVETFMPRNKQFQDFLTQEVLDHSQGLWQVTVPVRQQVKLHADNDADIGIVLPAPELHPY